MVRTHLGSFVFLADLNWVALCGDPENQCYDDACECQNNATNLARRTFNYRIKKTLSRED